MPVVHDPKRPEQIVISIDGPAPGVDSGPTLLVESLDFRYPGGRQALRDVSLSISRGDKVALVGPNGAGKSTLILQLNGILQGEGRIEITGFEDVAFGPLHMGYPATEVRARVGRALAQIGMIDYADRLSHHLSAGEKKRIAIATVLSMDPEILVLDEPSAGLDPRARRKLINLLRELPVTMLVSTHDMLMVRELFPRMVIMDDGRIVADGPTKILLEDNVLLEAHGLECP